MALEEAHRTLPSLADGGRSNERLLRLERLVDSAVGLEQVKPLAVGFELRARATKNENAELAKS
jgi:hypothetical protein